MEANGGIAGIYDAESDFSNAEHYYQVCVRLSAEIKDSTTQANSLGWIGHIYFLQDKLDAALLKYQEAMKLITDTIGSYKKNTLGNLYTYFGDLYKKLGTNAISNGQREVGDAYFLNALTQYQLGAASYHAGNFESGVVYAYVHTGELLIKMGRIEEAKSYLEKALVLSKASGITEDIRDSYRGVVSLDSAEGNYKKAFEDQKMYLFYRDSLNNSGTAKLSAEYSMQYEAGKRDAIAKLEKEKKEAEIQHTQIRHYFIMSVLGILVLAGLIIVLILFRNNKHRQKAYKLLEKQKLATETQRDKADDTLRELKSTQAQLIQSEKMASLGELTAGIAHEIQNPLNFVNNFAEINVELTDELFSEAGKGNREEVIAIAKDIRDNASKINLHGKRADAIVKGMLQHSKSSTGHKESTDINKLTDEYLRLAYHGMRAKDKTFNATLQTSFDESVGLVKIIPQDIGRVLLNLLNNAFYTVHEKKMRASGDYEPAITVSTTNVNNKIVISVEDNGNGVPNKIIDKIFQPFFTTKPTGEGTGLGLSLSYDIVKAHGGELRIETNENEGSKFHIIMPAI